MTTMNNSLFDAMPLESQRQLVAGKALEKLD